MKRKTIDDIYRSYIKDIYRYLLSLCHDHYLAEDMMQETFYRAYLYLEDCPEGKIKPWLFRVAHNAFVDFKRKDSRSQLKDGEFFKTISYSRTPEDELLAREQFEEIDAVIDCLPEKQRQAILLCDFYDMSYREAAEIMDISLAHFKVLVFRARQKIRQNRERDDCFG